MKGGSGGFGGGRKVGAVECSQAPPPKICELASLKRAEMDVSCSHDTGHESGWGSVDTRVPGAPFAYI
jgi:hypothetical protein